MIKARFDRGSGVLHSSIDLETDSTAAGPRGRLIVTLYDTRGRALATAVSRTIGVPGKPGGRAVHRTYHTSQRLAQLPRRAWSRVSSARIWAQCQGSTTGWFGIDLRDVKRALQFGIKLYRAAY